MRIVPVAAQILLLTLSAGAAMPAPLRAQTPGGEAAPTFQVFLIGDVGAAPAGAPLPALTLLRERLQQAGPNSAVVFLGGNIPCCGLPDSGTVQRAEAEARLLAQLQAVQGYEGRVVFLPGEEDVRDDRFAESLARQEQFVEAFLGRGNTFLPDDGLPGPVEVKLTDRLSLVVLNTQWWLTGGPKPFGDAGAYEVEEEGDFLLQLDDLLRRRDDRDLLVVGHHPVLSAGRHGGHFSLRDHLFPLTARYSKAYVPLPVVGSLYPLYRQYFGTSQDLVHDRYKGLRQALSQTFLVHERLLYASAHDHSLQYFAEGRQHFLVSGAGGRVEPVGPRGAFAAAEPGFLTVQFYGDGTAWLEAWTAGEDAPGGRPLFRTQLFAPAPDRIDPGLPADAAAYPDYRDSTFVVAANPAYEAGPVKRFFWGSHHRRAWATPVEVPVLDLGREAGGLRPVQRGGGMQTVSLRLEGADGKTYVLRSIDKDPTGTVPVNLQGTVATDIVQDQIASIHPYGAFIVPPLARAAGVYHTNPRLVYVPDDPRLGVYRTAFGNRVMMLEERPDDDMSDAPSVGRSEEVIGPQKLYREIDGDNDHRVDQRAFLRARLFDMLLSDWDRHRDQWRWASFDAPDGEGKIYRPIPRDRDWAFNRLDGLLPPLASTGLLITKFQPFTKRYGFLRGLTQNGLEQDRRFTAALERSDWLAIADSIRLALTDEVIDAAVRQWPAPIAALDGPVTAEILKARRDRLPEVAAEYYRLLARVVDVVGSHKHERFEVTRLSDDTTRVVVYKTTKEGEVRKELYRRTFRSVETGEVRLYGLDGDDAFTVTGEVGRGPRVVVVGGPGRDTFADASRVRGPGRHTRFYDTEAEGSWTAGPETRVVRSDDPAVHEYNPFSYQHDSAQPILFFGSNPDDGVFLGGGIRLVRHGFRKLPYARQHELKANVASRTQAYNVVYRGHYVRVLGAWDVALEASYLSPDNIRNFYGLGNETQNTDRDAHYYQARLTQLTLAPALLKRVEEGATFQIGPRLAYTKVREDEDRFIGQVQEGISAGTFDDQWFAGLDAAVRLEQVDSPLNPRQGFRWTNTADLSVGLRGSEDRFGTLGSEVSVYLSPSRRPQVTLAARVGVWHNVGDFPFYRANTLGGKTNLRGFRSTRFAGRTSLYQNVELRVGLGSFSTYLARGQVGVLGFFDHGRVWTDGEQSRRWHRGAGGGVWVNLFDLFVVTGSVGFSEEDRTLMIGLGFLY